MTLTLVRQSYGIAMAQCTFGGPRGIWLECTAVDCLSSDKIKGAPSDLSDADAAKVFRANGWTGEGVRMLKAKCPKCNGVTK